MSTTQASSPDASKAPQSPVEILQRNGEYSDYTVKCGERTWHLHRAIICSRSTYFKTACDGGFKEAEQGLITLEEDDSELIDVLLNFLYIMKYPLELEDMMFHAKMYAIADKYGLPDLKGSAKETFERLVRGKWDSALFPKVASLVYELTPEGDRGLRDLLVQHLWANRATLLPKEDFQECILKYDELQKDVLKKLFLEPGSSEQKKTGRYRPLRISLNSEESSE